MKTSPVIDTKICGQFVRMIERNDGLWFVTADVLSALGAEEDAHSTLSRTLRGEDMRLAQISDADRLEKISIVSENGLYDFALLLDKPEAEPVKEWVIQNFCLPTTDCPTGRNKAVLAKETKGELINKALDILRDK